MVKDIIVSEIKKNASNEYAEFIRKAIQSENGYGKGDVVIGCRMPILRKIMKKYNHDISTNGIIGLLRSEYHEARALALITMVERFKKGDESLRKEIVEIYLNNTKFINNWDLVDMSSAQILGNYFDSSDAIFETLSNSNSLWENRMAIVSSHSFIKRDNFDLTFNLCMKFMKHHHHLIHKACGWMLREVGKRNESALIDFIQKHSSSMPKIMLSYAREKLRDKRLL
jgi:3-methyladenine DNA glycosylase AlkD